jgi:hypothetical protein
MLGTLSAARRSCSMSSNTLRWPRSHHQSRLGPACLRCQAAGGRWGLAMAKVGGNSDPRPIWRLLAALFVVAAELGSCSNQPRPRPCRPPSSEKRRLFGNFYREADG